MLEAVCNRLDVWSLPHSCQLEVVNETDIDFFCQTADIMLYICLTLKLAG